MLAMAQEARLTTDMAVNQLLDVVNEIGTIEESLLRKIQAEAMTRTGAEAKLKEPDDEEPKEPWQK